MAKPFRKLLDPLLARAGYKLDRLAPRSYPVEFDDADRDIVAHVAGNELSMASPERLFATLLACKHVCRYDIPGDFVECGVWRGGNAMLAADVFRRLSPERRTYCFDTYAGMTEPTAADVTRGGSDAAKQFREMARADHNDWCYASLEEVQGNFRRRGLDGAVFVKGDVAQTLRAPQSVPARISVLRLDTDWYESTKLELEILYPRLQPGGILIVDDYGYWGGSRKAVDEYFSSVAARPFFHYVDHTARVGIKNA